MKKILLAISLLSCASFAQPAFAQNDKALHFAAGFTISFTVGAWKPKVGFAVGGGAGLAKVIHDSKQRGNKFDNADLAATVGGALAGSGLAWFLYHRKGKATSYYSLDARRADYLRHSISTDGRAGMGK
jgi:hypothetical protein